MSGAKPETQPPEAAQPVRQVSQAARRAGKGGAGPAYGHWRVPALWLAVPVLYLACWTHYDGLRGAAQRAEMRASVRLRLWYAAVTGRDGETGQTRLARVGVAPARAASSGGSMAADERKVAVRDQAANGRGRQAEHTPSVALTARANPPSRSIPASTNRPAEPVVVARAPFAMPRGGRAALANVPSTASSIAPAGLASITPLRVPARSATSWAAATGASGSAAGFRDDPVQPAIAAASDPSVDYRNGAAGIWFAQDGPFPLGPHTRTVAPPPSGGGRSHRVVEHYAAAPPWLSGASGAPALASATASPASSVDGGVLASLVPAASGSPVTLLDPVLDLARDVLKATGPASSPAALSTNLVQNLPATGGTDPAAPSVDPGAGTAVGTHGHYVSNGLYAINGPVLLPVGPGLTIVTGNAPGGLPVKSAGTTSSDPSAPRQVVPQAVLSRQGQDGGASNFDVRTVAQPLPPADPPPRDTSIFSALGASLVLDAQRADDALLERLSRASTTALAPSRTWFSVAGGQTRLGGSPGFEAHHYGFTTGYDHRADAATRIGLAAGYSHADIGEQDTGDRGTTDTLHLALYGVHRFGPVNLAANVSYGLDFLDQKRPLSPGSTARGEHLGQQVSTAGEASLPMRVAGATLTPRLGLRYTWFHANGFDESDAPGEALGVGRDTIHSLQPYVGVTFDQAFGDALRPVNLRVRAGYARELLDTSRSVSVTDAQGTTFVAPGASLPQGQLTAGLAVSVRPRKALSLSLSYDTMFHTGHASAQLVDFRLGYRF